MKKEQGSRLGFWVGVVLVCLSIVGGIISCLLGYCSEGIILGLIVLFIGIGIGAWFDWKIEED